MPTVLISVIGSLIVFLMSVMLWMIKSTNSELAKLESMILETKKDIADRVAHPDCIRQMTEIKDDLKDAVRDIRSIEKGGKNG